MDFIRGATVALMIFTVITALVMLVLVYLR